MFEDIVGKKCKIVKKDGFVKFGVVGEVSEKFIKIEFLNKAEYVLIDSIISLSVIKENEMTE